MNYQGNFLEDATVYIPFNTFDSNDPSASVTITNLVQGDVEIFKNGVIQTTPGAGVTLSLNLGTNNGSHLIAIDTSNTTDASFYVTGADYQVRINGTTIDGATINAWVGSFSIENRFMRGTDSANTTTPPTVGQIQTELEENGASLLDTIRDELANATDGLSALKALLDAIPTTAMRGTDSASTHDAAAVKTAIEAGGSSLAQILTDTGTTLENRQVTIAADAARLTAARAAVLTDLIDGGRLDLILDIIAADTTTDIPALIATAQSDLNIITGTSGVLIDTNAVDADALAADAITEIWAKAMQDLAQGAPSATASVLDAINWMYEAFRNKSTTTATLFTLLKDDGNTALAKSTLSDDGAITTKDELVSGA